MVIFLTINQIYRSVLLIVTVAKFFSSKNMSDFRRNEKPPYNLRSHKIFLSLTGSCP